MDQNQTLFNQNKEDLFYQLNGCLLDASDNSEITKEEKQEIARFMLNNYYTVTNKIELDNFLNELCIKYPVFLDVKEDYFQNNLINENKQKDTDVTNKKVEEIKNHLDNLINIKN